jgi:hypothetical protein
MKTEDQTLPLITLIARIFTDKDGQFCFFNDCPILSSSSMPAIDQISVIPVVNGKVLGFLR